MKPETKQLLIGASVVLTVGVVIGCVIGKKKYENIYSAMPLDAIKQRVLAQRTVKKMAYPSTAPSPALPTGELDRNGWIGVLDAEALNLTPQVANLK